MSNINQLESAYWAGFFDGEGCVQLTGRYNNKQRPYFQYICNITLVNTLNIFNPLIERYGGNIALQKRTNPKHNSAYIYRLQGRRALPFIQAIYPYAKIKKQELELATAFIETINPRWTIKGLPRVIIRKRNALIEQLAEIRQSKRARVKIKLPSESEAKQRYSRHSTRVACPYCGKEVYARGLQLHIYNNHKPTV